MRATHLALRASQALSSDQASRLVSEAARRASAKSSRPSASKRPRTLRQYTDIIAVGLASLVAASALKNKREHQDRVAFLEAELVRANHDRDQAAQSVHTIKNSLLHQAADAVTSLESVTTRNKDDRIVERTLVLHKWLDDAFNNVSTEIQAQTNRQGQLNADAKPKMI